MGQVERGGQSDPPCVWDTQAAQQVVGKSWHRPQAIGASPTSSRTRSTDRWPAGPISTPIVYVAESGPKASRTKRLAIMDQDSANVQYITPGKTWR
jgi:TolB protein